MTNRFIKYYAIIGTTCLVAGAVLFYNLLPDPSAEVPRDKLNDWEAPDIRFLSDTGKAAIIRYGRALIEHTSDYLGPHGTVSHISNGMNCGNCHLDAGTRADANCFAAVAANYPKYRPRSGKRESIEFRVNDCMERSLNGRQLDSGSVEMRAMVAYIRWVGKDVPKGKTPKAAGVPKLPFLQRAADPLQGRVVFVNKCQHCHGGDGRGLSKEDSTGYLYPPLWGAGSYNVSAGMYRLSALAAFIRYNMPYNALYSIPELTNEEAWDVAAYIGSQNRPEKFFAADWPDIRTKPFDYPFGPFADSFSAQEHKYGPFTAMQPKKKQGN